jgi:hypothetical protein
MLPTTQGTGPYHAWAYVVGTHDINRITNHSPMVTQGVDPLAAEVYDRVSQCDKGQGPSCPLLRYEVYSGKEVGFE